MVDMRGATLIRHNVDSMQAMEKEKASPIYRKMPSFIVISGLDGGHIGGGRAFRSLFDIEGHTVPFVEGFETGSVDCAMMHKHVRPVVLLDESESFPVIKPLYRSIGHTLILLSIHFNGAN